MSSKQKHQYPILPFFLAALTAALFAFSVEVFWRRRDVLVRNISSMVGEHLIGFRASSQVGGPMPIPMLSTAMNQVISRDDDAVARSALDSMMGVVTEAKRRSFALPLVHKDVALRVKAWAEKPETTSSQPAAKLLTHIVERHAQHMDQLIAQSYAIISTTDSAAATQSMRALAHLVDGAAIAGLGIQKSLILVKPNDETVQTWLSSSEVQPKLAAEFLMKTIDEAVANFNS